MTNSPTEYRAFDEEEGMIYGIGLNPDGFVSVFSKPMEIAALYPAAIPLKFTGLTDCNKVKIFEGDILQGWSKSRGKWYKNSTRTKAVRWIESKNYIGFNVASSNERLEVIGNVYEHPELVS